MKTGSKIGAVLAAGLLASGPVHAAGAAAEPGWRDVKAKVPAGAQLHRVAAFSRKDAWAVGNRYSRAGMVFLHWDGKSWTSPKSSAAAAARLGFPGGDNYGVVGGSSGSDVWVAGEGSGKKERNKPMAAHWDGKKWKVFALPNSGGGVYVDGITVLSKKDAWISGSDITHQPYVARWNGKKWSAVGTPRLAGGGHLAAVVAAGAKQAWAVGYQGAKGDRPLAEYWNGKKWSIAKTPNVTGGLTSIALLPGKKLWAAGNARFGGDGLVLRSDGGAWRAAPFPLPISGHNFRLAPAVAWDGKDSVWVGLGVEFLDADTTRSKYAHWNVKKKSWDIKAGSPHGASGQPAVLGLAHVPGTRSLWSVVRAQGVASIEVGGALPR